MPLGVALSLLVFGAGWLIVRPLGLSKGPASIGLAPAVGAALLAVVIGACATFGLPPLLATAGLVVISGAGLAWAARDAWETRLDALRQPEHRHAFIVLACALAAPVFISGFGMSGIEVPLSTHDGAFHVEAIQALRDGAPLQTWYPLGFHAMVAAFLGLVPWVDTARGTLEAALALTYLAPLAVFGLGCVMWRRTVVAAVGALLLAITFEYPYYPQVWSGWPLAMALLMVWGVWCVAAEYLDRPRSSVAVCAAVLLAGILITHGTELFTVAIGLVVILLGAWRRVQFARLGRDVALTLLAAIVLAAPYLPTLLTWARGGGAVAVAYALPVIGGGASVANLAETPQGTFLGQADSTWTLWASTFGSALIVDLPVRVVLIILGAVAAFRWRNGRLLVVLLLMFFGISQLVAYTDSVPIIRLLYALTFPWGMDYRLAMVQAVAAALLGGGGVVALGRFLSGSPRRWPRLLAPGRDAARRRATLGRLAAALLAIGTATGLAVVLAGVAAAYNSYTADDAAAMRWLRENVQAGEVVANDGSVDAGIWAPYKAGVPIIATQASSVATTLAGQAMLTALGRLDDPESRALACTQHVRYVYHGAKQTAWKKTRFFPSVAELRASPFFEAVYSSGGAGVFRVRVPCE